MIETHTCKKRDQLAWIQLTKQGGKKEKKKGEKKTYNTWDSLVVTDPTTSQALTGLSMGERTGSRVFQWVWSYVLIPSVLGAYKRSLHCKVYTIEMCVN